MASPPPPPKPTPPIPGSGGALTTTFVPPKAPPVAAGAGTTTSEPGKQLTIPGNMLPWLEDASESTGVPLAVLAAAVYRETGFNKFDDRYGPALMLVAARRIKDEYTKMRSPWENPQPGDPLAPGAAPSGFLGWVDAAAQAGNAKNPAAYRNGILSALGLDNVTAADLGRPGFSVDSLWTQGNDRALADPDRKHDLASIFGEGGFSVGGSIAEASRATLNDVYRLFRALTGRDPVSDAEAQPYVGLSNTQAENAITALPDAAEWRKYGTKVSETKRWADGVYMDLVKRLPTTAEVKEIVDRGYTADALEQSLRKQPYGTGTIGQFSDARKIADQYARQELGREADPGEINFMMQNGIAAPEAISSFYEQMRQRKETGDPAFAWVGNPTQWRNMEKSVTDVWKAAGLTAAVDPHLINQAVTAGWTKGDIQNYVDGLPAPGFPQGVTVGQVNRIKPIAAGFKSAWDTAAVTNAEITHLMDFSPDQIRDYYGNQPKTLPESAKVVTLGDLASPGHIERPNAQTGVVTPRSGPVADSSLPNPRVAGL